MSIDITGLNTKGIIVTAENSKQIEQAFGDISTARSNQSSALIRTVQAMVKHPLVDKLVVTLVNEKVIGFLADESMFIIGESQSIANLIEDQLPDDYEFKPLITDVVQYIREVLPKVKLEHYAPAGIVLDAEQKPIYVVMIRNFTNHEGNQSIAVLRNIQKLTKE